MTFEQMTDMVKASHAEASITLIKALLNTNLKMFCKECRLIRKKQAIIEVGATVTYTSQTAAQIAAMTGKAAMKGSGAYIASLNTDIDTLYGIEYLNSSYQPLYVPDVDMPWKMDSTNLWFGYNDTTAIADGISGIIAHYYGIPATLSADVDTPSIPEDFHEAIPYMVMMKLHGNSNDMARMGFFRSQYDKIRVEAKRWALQNMQFSPGTVVQYDF